MGHSKNRGRRRLTLPLPLRAKMIGLAMFVGGFMGLITSAQLDPISARVERVIDGDTIQVRFEGKSYTVRLIGVDTPETKHPTKAAQYFGREASAFTKAALEGKTVLLQKDLTGDTVDRYGRWLRYVLLDGDNFNARLIRDGYAHAYHWPLPFPRSRFAPPQGSRQSASLAFGVWHSALPLSALPVTGAGRAVPPSLRVCLCRLSWVRDKDQTLNFRRRKHTMATSTFHRDTNWRTITS